MLIKETIHAYGVEGFSHIQENCATQNLVKVYFHPFKDAGQVQRHIKSEREHQLLVTQLTSLVYFSEDPSD
jgi:hypothetical protein